MARLVCLSGFHWMLVAIASCLGRGAAAQSEDPWPYWGRTPTRFANTTTIGPQTPTVAWHTQIDFYPQQIDSDSSCVLDRNGWVFGGNLEGIWSVDSGTRSLRWVINAISGAFSAPTVWNGLVFWGVTTSGNFFCTDADTGMELWRMTAPDGFDVSPVVSPDGIVYFNDRSGKMYARRAIDGAEIWTATVGLIAYCSPAMDWPMLVTAGSGSGGSDLDGLDPFDGARRWRFDSGREVFGVPMIHDGDVFMASADRFLYRIDGVTGAQEWRFNTEQLNRGPVALGHDGTIYTATAGNTNTWTLFAVSPQGQELWRWLAPGDIYNAPVVSGDGTIYVCSLNPDTRHGWVHAIRPDGTKLWTRQMPAEMRASPMLAPDGTLYVVCSDKNLYALHDPPNPTLDLLGSCPGTMRAVIHAASPGGRIALLFAAGRAYRQVHSTSLCDGTWINLDGSARIAAFTTADAAGEARIEGRVPPAACGRWLQAVDLTSCHVTNVAKIE